MAHSKQAQKRIRQQEKQRIHNKAIASRMRTAVKTVLAHIESGDKDAAAKAIPHAMKCVDKAAKHRLIHANTAARKKSMMMRSVQRTG